MARKTHTVTVKKNGVVARIPKTSLTLFKRNDWVEQKVYKPDIKPSKRKS